MLMIKIKWGSGKWTGSWQSILVATIISMSGAAAVADDSDNLRVYPAAQDEPLSQQFTVGANQQNVPVYLATILAMLPADRIHHDLQHFKVGDTGQTSFASFDMRTGPVHLSITCPGSVNDVKLLPCSSGITPKILGSTVTLDIAKPGQYVLEINGDWAHSLQIFANPWDDLAPSANDPNVIYYGPGIHKVTSIKVTSGQTVYLAGDAVVYGTMGSPGGAIFELHGDNITLRGRGIIDGSLCPHGVRNMVYAKGTNIAIEGIIMRDSGEWNLPITGSDHVTVKNIKIFGYRGNSDGIDINASRDVDVSDSYVRTGDDLIIVKTKMPETGEAHHITVEHCVLWNELAHALSLGAELQQNVDDVHFSDCDIIHDKGRAFLLRVFQCDQSTSSKITFENIRIEECQRLISLWIGVYVWSKSPWALEPERGHINDITFQNITSPAPERESMPVELVGFDSDHAIHDVKLDNITVGGHALSLSDVKSNQYVDTVEVTP